MEANNHSIIVRCSTRALCLLTKLSMHVQLIVSRKESATGKVRDCQKLRCNITGTEEFLVSVPSPCRKTRSEGLQPVTNVIFPRSGSWKSLQETKKDKWWEKKAISQDVHARECLYWASWWKVLLSRYGPLKVGIFTVLPLAENY